MNPKPIFVILLPVSLSMASSEVLLRQINENANKTQMKKEYHTLILSGNKDDFEFRIIDPRRATEPTKEEVDELMEKMKIFD